MTQNEHQISEPTGAAYLAAPGLEDQLLADLGTLVRDKRDRLILTDAPPRFAPWALNIWQNPVWVPVHSIKTAAKFLRSLQRNWAYFPIAKGGRGKLISSHLPHVSAKPLIFPEAKPTAPLGSWTLWEPNLILAATDCSSPFMHGEAQFQEDKITPPNRAYLKLWEALTLMGDLPGPGDTCLDLGASPGGWTWVLGHLGAKVIAVDKAPLDPAIAAMPTVTYRQESAFGLDPRKEGPVTWVCSDIICYPERLLALVTRWIEADAAKNFICTLKFQGTPDYAIAQAFQNLPGSTVQHLFWNKHELTWMCRRG